MVRAISTGVLPFLFLLVFSCGNSAPTPPKTTGGKPDPVYFYTVNCAPCHGDKGDGGISGAKNLITSTVDAAEVERQIKNGKGTMPAFGEKIKSAEEMDALVKYVMELRN